MTASSRMKRTISRASRTGTLNLRVRYRSSSPRMCSEQTISWLARRRGRPAGEIVRDSLEKYLAVERFRALRAKTLPRAAEHGFLTDDDVFKA